MRSYLPICEMLPDSLTPAERERRVTTVIALIRQAIFTVESQGMPGDAVIAIAEYVLESEKASRASQEAR